MQMELLSQAVGLKYCRYALLIATVKLHAEPTIILTSPKVDLSYEHDMAARLSTQSSLDTAGILQL